MEALPLANSAAGRGRGGIIFKVDLQVWCTGHHFI
jgi:hypothetical protein